MKKHRFCNQTLAGGLLLAGLPSLALQAQTIPNPGFETDTFVNFPGYVSGNSPITGWTGTFESSHGLNPAGTSPFADNGVVPEGVNVAFIQSNSNDSTLETTISGLTVGQAYQLSFRANARGGNTPLMEVLVDDAILVDSGVTEVGGVNPWRRVAVYFTAAQTTARLVIRNKADNDNTVVVDDFTIAPTTMPWSWTAWEDDATSGIDSTFIYTHAYNFGAANNFTINGVSFTGIGGGNPAVEGRLATTGLPNVFNTDDNFLAGDSRPLANDFLYNGFPSTITLSGLTPGQGYLLSLFSVGWEDATNRWGTFRSGNQELTIDQDAFNNDSGIRIDYTYTADATGSVTIETHPVRGNSIHIYGIANREMVAPAVPVITGQPDGAMTTTGSSVTFSGQAAGAGPIAYQWFRNGTALAGETNSTLILDVTNAATQSGSYTLEATNAGGTTVSDAAFLEVYNPVTGTGLFNTGYSTEGDPLFGGEIDPNYLLVQNPFFEGDTTTYIQTTPPGAWLVSGTASWIGPSPDTSTAPGPDPTLYVYRTGFDLTGKPTAGVIIGEYATDNNTTAIRVNDVDVPGVALSPAFMTTTPLMIRTENLPAGTVTAGPNTLDFEVNNGGIGFTGLLVDNISFAVVPDGIAPQVAVQPVGGTIVTGSPVTLTSRGYGTAGLTYQWSRNNTPIPGATGMNYSIAEFSEADNGGYTVTIANAAGSVTSEVATLTASDVPPTITTPPQNAIVGIGESVTLGFTGGGSPPFTYEWLFNDVAIPGATAATYQITGASPAMAGEYKVKVTNAFGTITSAAGTVSVIYRIPGLYNTGVDDTGALVPDGEPDPHYTLIFNPGGENDVPATVHSSTIWPIVAGPWLANTADAKWIAPAADTSAAVGEDFDAGAGPGIYVYRTTFDLTGFNPSSAKIEGRWASDNDGVDIRVNEISTGVSNAAGFTTMVPFSLTASNAEFVPGINTLDFYILNATVAVGPTAVRIDNLLATADPAVNVDLPTLTITLNQSNQPVITFTGEQGTQYPIQRSTTLTPQASWTVVGTVTGGAGGAVEFTDTAAPAGKAYYRAVIPVPSEG